MTRTPREFVPGDGVRKNEKPISDYGVIGDLHTVALVGMDASIDFMCFPFFDSPSIFAAVLDHEKGGYFELSPMLLEMKPRQFYLPDTNILISRFLSHEGVAEISDFMVVDEREEPSHQLIRRAKTVQGQVHFRMCCRPRFNYGQSRHRVVRVSENEVLFESEGAGKLRVRLIAQVPLSISGDDVEADFLLKANETAAFILEDADRDPQYGHEAEIESIPVAFKRTLNYWQTWVRKSHYKGRWREMVSRSALVLKLLTSKRHGSIVAAPTFGLPETIGGERNWDYRYTWIRDASFTLYGLIRLGYTEEAKNFIAWVEDRCNELDDGGLQVVYGLDGRHDLPEEVLAHLEGYMDSRPVRIGNGASKQLQLDIYGELMDSVYLFNKYGEPIHYDLWQNLVRLMNWLCENWNQPDEGIWEVRGGRHHFLYSRVMCWVAIDRALRLADKRSFPAPRPRWEAARDEIYYDVMNNFWNPEVKAFVQYKGADVVDASALIMPLVRFISPTDPRFESTMRAIKDQLVVDSLVYRYSDRGAPDGLTGREGSFSMCTFWYAECLARAGRLQEARFFFEKMQGYGNHLGLFAEELGPRGEHLGNFPQAFTHLALISAAFNIDRRLDEAECRCAR